MEKLNELVELAKKADYKPCRIHDHALMQACSPEIILAIAEAFRALELERDELRQRAEAAEARLAELTQQQPIGWLNDAYLGRGVIDGEVGEEDQGPGYIPVYRHPFNDVPAPAINLAGLVPDAAPDLPDNHRDIEWRGMCDGWNSCRAAILRKIEEAK